MKRAEEGVKRATQAVEDAKNAYEDLKKTIEDYDESQKAINELEQGTLEFKQAVYEANLEVLKLMELFPSLKEVGNIVNQNGRLIITDQGKEAMENASFQQVSNALTALTSSQIVSLNTRRKSAYLEMGEKTPIINREDGTMGSLVGAEIGKRMAEIDIDRYYDLQQENLSLAKKGCFYKIKKPKKFGEKKVLHLKVKQNLNGLHTIWVYVQPCLTSG